MKTHSRGEIDCPTRLSQPPPQNSFAAVSAQIYASRTKRVLNKYRINFLSRKTAQR
jgi:hypothetical protein